MIQGIVYQRRLVTVAVAVAVFSGVTGYLWQNQKDQIAVANAIMRQELARVQSEIGLLSQYTGPRLAESQNAAERFREAMFTEDSWKAFTQARFPTTDWAITTETMPPIQGADFVRRVATMRYNSSAVSDWFIKILGTLRRIEGDAIGITTIEINTTGTDQRRQFEGIRVNLTFFQRH